MGKGYLLAEPWPSFNHGGSTYDLSHLNEYFLVARDSAKAERRIIVTFADHCFTRPPEGDGDVAPTYPGCSRLDGRFCIERYELSLGIRALIEYALGGTVWNSTGDHFIIVRGVDYRGSPIDYVIIFSLDRIRGLPADLHMRVRSAHKRDREPIDTFGSIRFSHLLRLTIEGKKPGKIFDRNRKRPK